MIKRPVKAVRPVARAEPDTMLSAIPGPGPCIDDKADGRPGTGIQGRRGRMHWQKYGCLSNGLGPPKEQANRNVETRTPAR